MDTPYLDDAITRHEQALKINMLSDGGKEALEEFKAIKAALRQPLVKGSLPDVSPHTCPECNWLCDCTAQPCSCCFGNDL